METVSRSVSVLHRRRLALSFVAAALALLTLAPASFEAGAPASVALHFSRLPSRAVAGQAVTVAVDRAHPNALCSLAVSYGDKSSQSGLAPAPAVKGGVSWTWTIPATVQADRAQLTAHCTGSKRISGKLLVVGSLIPTRLSVEKNGFSLRTSSSGSTDVSYGVIIRNHSPNADALNVTVLVNFVLSNNHLLGSASNTIAMIPAASSYALGNNLGFPGAAPIARLEIVIQVGGTNRHVGHAPALANIVIEPSTYEQQWVADVAGELINNDAHLRLESASYSAVIFDAAGNVLGGGNGSSYGSPLPPGTREVFKLSNGGFKDIPVEKAASVIVSALPTWQQPGA
jgi:hypothetical protein